jgi:hypothetical protein
MIIKNRGQVVWEGDITPLAANGTIAVGDQHFDTLEALFLHLTGERYKPLDWL